MELSGIYFIKISEGLKATADKSLFSQQQKID